MPRPLKRDLSYCTLVLALAGWGCSSDDTPSSPTATPEQSVTAAALYTVRDLGTLGGPGSHAYGINNAGVVVGGSSVDASLVPHAFVWKNGVMKDLGTLAGAKESQANAINNDGIIVGWSRNSAGYIRAVRWAADGRKRSLGTLGGLNSEARAINDFGVIVGWSETASGQRHAFRWQNGVMTDLGTLGGTTSGANGINRGGAIVGQSTTASGEAHAFKWKDGAFKDLGASFGSLHFQYSVATAVNTKGQIAGVFGPPDDAAGEEQDFTAGFVFYQDVTKLCCGFRRPTTHVRGINANGIIVGWEEEPRAEDPSDTEDAWIYESGTTRLLPELAFGHSGAEGINLRGDIVGYSQRADGKIHAALWRRQ
jgi:probable HAF family extracellular repeat protein